MNLVNWSHDTWYICNINKVVHLTRLTKRTSNWYNGIMVGSNVILAWLNCDYEYIYIFLFVFFFHRCAPLDLSHRIISIDRIEQFDNSLPHRSMQRASHCNCYNAMIFTVKCYNLIDSRSQICAKFCYWSFSMLLLWNTFRNSHNTIHSFKNILALFCDALTFVRFYLSIRSTNCWNQLTNSHFFQFYAQNNNIVCVHPFFVHKFFFLFEQLVSALGLKLQNCEFFSA